MGTQAGESVTGARVLSLTQPWATLVVTGEKRIETRSWRTAHRGRLLIHAAKTFPRWAKELCNEAQFAHALGWELAANPQHLPRGVILGCVSLEGCIPTSGPLADQYLSDIGSSERALGDYSPGRYAWLLRDAAEFRVPIPAKGSLGLWTVPREHADVA
jgi:activating signal cointegrator 1